MRIFPNGDGHEFLNRGATVVRNKIHDFIGIIVNPSKTVYAPMMPVTMLDIARDVNVSVVTVSKVLRNQGRISEATRKLVLRRAHELNTR